MAYLCAGRHSSAYIAVIPGMDTFSNKSKSKIIRKRALRSLSLSFRNTSLRTYNGLVGGQHRFHNDTHASQNTPPTQGGRSGAFATSCSLLLFRIYVSLVPPDCKLSGRETVRSPRRILGVPRRPCPLHETLDEYVALLLLRSNYAYHYDFPSFAYLSLRLLFLSFVHLLLW